MGAHSYYMILLCSILYGNHMCKHYGCSKMGSYVCNLYLLAGATWRLVSTKT